MLINFFMFCTLKGLLFHVILNLFYLSQLIMELRAVWCGDLFLALSALEEIKDNTGTRPPQLDSFKDTCNVENVTTAYLDTRALVVAL